MHRGMHIADSLCCMINTTQHYKVNDAAAAKSLKSCPICVTP